ncbi:hypothetical protein [Zoogloea oleivorans]|uniref:hypothetical protein n=1 Tax=Zoogloea oleivorans TaxID=1552750 RepID=UPI0016525E46|nr:hypothetical protein [Zoogloea oleivorans]
MSSQPSYVHGSSDKPLIGQPIGRASRPANRTDGAGYPCGSDFSPTARVQPVESD